MQIAAVIVAAGRGTRAGGEIPKQWQEVGEHSVAAWSCARFRSRADIAEIILVIHPDDRVFAQSIKGVTLVHGGATRDGSVHNGLKALAADITHVLIHDVARCTVSDRVIDGVIDALQTADGAAPALPVSDALWIGADGKVSGTQDRTGLFRAQTPQGFALRAILNAHGAHQGGAADDVEVARSAGLDVVITEGDENNLKITMPDDFARAAKILEQRVDIRLGNGFDVHAFEDGDHVTLCGVKVPHNKALKGHSDADVGMHAVTDAIYGALGDGDIGQHFPPSDPQWKGAASEIFLRHAVDLAASRGFTISNVDCTLICEQPKIGPHAGTMKDTMAALLQITPDRVSVKATTSERLGFTGREEGIAALATATLVAK
ncbi:bifunctional 2-C-methyl-D-erythritol 4-phosphate cytidylyltransferase/2-C-methyl-D-erythritol 2,4-cyclodiphosphate synthase [Planktotalea frisia]|uniref:bifunctional 2-C-methyl-D-erythritol 4-phosphate cytidylyltransferase/2-C-methyl-D-erythritol 2,4-cyclodiphosphate synthase n=1 Tax=Planktotalea frisia TaxID=696762 RepID=UPI002354E2D1|nr:bifunctional 2-C-methyl-D-erythritol 4-phosphate cytidylyltransferase/2-C-methyl-D-erythritol 2,4-cyclodiphosphate synthase [Planktotalea frisia]